MYWHAEKTNGEIIVLTEREALTHFEKNNISERMRLRFVGVSTGKHHLEAKNKVTALINEHRPEGYVGMKPEEKNVQDQVIREAHLEEIKEIIENAGKLEFEEAKKTGVIRPNKSLHIHTKSTDGHSRDEILGSMKM